MTEGRQSEGVILDLEQRYAAKIMQSVGSEHVLVYSSTARASKVLLEFTGSATPLAFL